MIAPPIRLACDVCGEVAFAVAPGSEDVWVAGILVAHGVPMRCWCRSHWLALYRRVAA